MTMIEKVAKALWDYNECGETGLQWEHFEKGTMSDLQKQIHLDMAKAAILAMKEIQPEYVSGIMQASLDATPINRCEQQALQVWQNTIDAILNNDPNWGM